MTGNKSNTLRVLTFHRVIGAGDLRLHNRCVWSATPEVFAGQMALLDRNFDVVSVQDVLGAVSGGPALPKRALLLTFDDGYRDFGEIAWPILRKMSLPAVLFVPTAFIGAKEAFWWDRLYFAFSHTVTSRLEVKPFRLSLASPEEWQSALDVVQRFVKQLPHPKALTFVHEVCEVLAPDLTVPNVLHTWDELRSLAAEGVLVAAHTRTHPLLTNVENEQLHAEVRGSQEDIKREIGKALPVFCYPGGAQNDRTIECLRREGFVLAFTTAPGHNNLETADLLRLLRTNVGIRTSEQILRLRLMPILSTLDVWRQARSLNRSSN